MALRSLICGHEAAYIADREKIGVVVANKEPYYINIEADKVEFERDYDRSFDPLIGTTVKKDIIEAQLGKSERTTRLELGHVFRYVKSL